MLTTRRIGAVLAVAAMTLTGAAPAAGGPWPMLGGDAGRTRAVEDARLPDDLHIAWTRQFREPVTAWKDDGRVMFDRYLAPVASDKLVFVGSTVSDRVTAYSVATGEEVWRYTTEGPVRVAPALAEGRLFVASDDGRLHCLDAATGKRQWVFRGGPRDRRLVGNERVISTWPCRGGPVVVDGTVYATAGIWPFMGTFVYALDTETGRVVWANDSTSFTWRTRPHPGAASFSGLSPQGHLAATDERLVVPGSASNPAVFDRASGEFLFYGSSEGTSVRARGRWAVGGGRIFDLRRGCRVDLDGLGKPRGVLLAPDAWYDGKHRIRLPDGDLTEKTRKHPYHDKTYDVLTGKVDRRRVDLGDALLKAGDRFLVRRDDSVRVVRLGEKAETVAEAGLGSRPVRSLVAGGRVIVVTGDHRLVCLSPEPVDSPAEHAPGETRPLAATSAAKRARAVLDAAGSPDGYAIVRGVDSGDLVIELLRQSDLHVVAVDADAERIAVLRRRLDQAGVYGPRSAAFVADPATLEFAPYMATLITTEAPDRAGLADAASVKALFETLRPYGGMAVLSLRESAHEKVAAAVRSFEQCRVSRADDLTVVARPGPLPGADDWLGQNGDAGNTRCSRDERVRAPLGVLWFGNALSNSLVLPRHGEGPVEQVAGGRLFIEGPDSLSASDVYTGRLLWTRRFPGLGEYYNHTHHQRGAHAVGGNFFAVSDAVYVAADKNCHMLDPATGQTRRTFQLPKRTDDQKRSDWLFLLVYEDLLIAGSHPKVPSRKGRYNQAASSERLVVMDRKSGKVLWTRDADESFGHYAVCAGRGKVFCVDRVAPEEVARLARRGIEPSRGRSILALDARSGELLWESDKGVGDQLTYVAEHDVLVADGALRGADGTVLWKSPTLHHYSAHPNPGLNSRPNPLWWGKWGLMVDGKRIVTQGQRIFDLTTGEQRIWTDHDGETHEWRYRRFHGCGPSAGGRHIVTFRSGCAGFLDLARDGGTGNLGGFRSGCTSNLIVAGGVLNAPDYTRTCGCAYANRSSLALVHMPDMEYWTFGGHPKPGSLAVNFGAPGDRATDTVLWWEYPLAGSPSPTVPVDVDGPAEPFLHHSSRIEGGDGLPWVAASGLVGAEKITIELPDTLRARGDTYIVRLHFGEFEATKPGRRVFDVAVGGETVRQKLDVFKLAGGGRRSCVLETRIEADKDIVIELHRSGGDLPAMIGGIEIHAASGRSP